MLLGPRSSFLTIPIGQGRVYCYADVLTGPGGPGPGLDDDPARLLPERFAGLPAPVPELLDRLPPAAGIHVAPIEQVAAQAGAGARWRWSATPLLRALGARIFRSNYRPLLDPP